MKHARKPPLRKRFTSTNNCTAMRPFLRNIESKKSVEMSSGFYSASRKFYSFTTTGVPSGAASKKRPAISAGRRMQPCEAAYGGT